MPNVPGGPQVRTIKLNIFSVLAFLLGLMAIFSIMTIVLSIVFGSLAVIFAVLSKGGDRKLNPISRNGFWMGLASLLVAAGIIVSTLFLYYNNQEYHEQINQLYEQLYGTRLDAYTSQFFSGNSGAENSISENSVSDNTASQNSVSQDSVSDNTVSHNSVSQDSVSDNTVSHNSVSQDSVSDNTISHNSGLVI